MKKITSTILVLLSTQVFAHQSASHIGKSIFHFLTEPDHLALIVGAVALITYIIYRVKTQQK